MNVTQNIFSSNLLFLCSELIRRILPKANVLRQMQNMKVKTLQHFQENVKH